MTKHVLGFAKMKETMAKYCNQFEDGIPLYVYIEGYENKTDILNLNIIGPKEDLKNSMMNDFSKKVVSVRNIIDFYNELGLFYIEKNIRSALIELESENRIEDCTPNAKKRRKGTFSDKRIVRFLK